MKSFARYLIPSIIATLFMSCYAMIDGIFIGQKIKDVGLSAINIAWPITAFVQSVGMAVGLSGGIYISYLKGKNEIEKSDKIKLSTIIIILVLAIIFGLILFHFSENIIILFGAKNLCLKLAHEYIKIILIGTAFQMLGLGLIPLLKNSGKVKLAMLASIMAIAINLFLDYIFIFILDWSLAGAALASVIAQIGSFIICFIGYFKELKGFIINKEIIKHIFLGALAPFILNYSYSFIIIITNSFCEYFGGNEAVAAYTLLSYMLYVVSAVSTSVSDSIQPLFSYYNAKEEYITNHRMLMKCLIISFLISLLFSFIFIIFKYNFGQLYNLSDIAYDYYKIGLNFYACGFLFVSISRVICSYFYSVENKKYANIITMIEPLILTPVAYFSICSVLKLNGLWLSYLIIQIILVFISISLLFVHRRREK